MDTISSGREGDSRPPARWLYVGCALLLGFVLGLVVAAQRASPRSADPRTAAPSPTRDVVPPEERMAQHLVASHWEAVADVGGPALAVRLNVRNAGPGPAKIIAIGAVPGLTLRRATYVVSNGVWQYRPKPPLVLEPAATVGIQLDYAVVDCPTARTSAGALPITVMTGDGPRTVRVTTADPYLDLEQPTLGQALACS